MSWHQLKTPNLGITYEGGQCLKAVREAFGIGKEYDSAMEDWDSGRKYYEAAPSNVYVPVYFSLGNDLDGHVAIHMPDGRVASSTQKGIHKGLYIHPNINDLIRIYAAAHEGCSYLGFSDEVNDVKVVENTGGNEMFDDLSVRRAVEGARYEWLPGQHPSEETINADIAAIQVAGGYGQFFQDIHNAARQAEEHNTQKLEKIDQIIHERK